MSAGKTLRIETQAGASIRWSADEWHTVADTSSKDTGLGVWVTDLPTESVPAGAEGRVTMHWTDHADWEGNGYAVKILAT
jgi:glucoamylase